MYNLSHFSPFSSFSLGIPRLPLLLKVQSRFCFLVRILLSLISSPLVERLKHSFSWAPISLWKYLHISVCCNSLCPGMLPFFSHMIQDSKLESKTEIQIWVFLIQKDPVFCVTFSGRGYWLKMQSSLRRKGKDWITS